MKIFSVCGIKASGKTTTIESIIAELSARGYKVGSVKDIHAEDFTIDPDQNTNTNRHKAAGSALVTARGRFETNVLYPGKLPIDKILDIYEREGYDWVVLEGVDDIAVPTVVTAHTEEDLEQKWSEMAIVASGRVGAALSEFRGKPSIDGTADIAKLADLLELRVYDRLPNFPPHCCGACGMGCEGLAKAIVAGESRRADCIADRGIELYCDGRRINMVPFVQTLLKNALLGVVSELEGYEKGCEVDVRLQVQAQ